MASSTTSPASTRSAALPRSAAAGASRHGTVVRAGLLVVVAGDLTLLPHFLTVQPALGTVLTVLCLASAAIVAGRRVDRSRRSGWLPAGAGAAHLVVLAVRRLDDVPMASGLTRATGLVVLAAAGVVTLGSLAALAGTVAAPARPAERDHT